MLFDTTVVVLLLRIARSRHRRWETAELIRAARDAIRDGTAVLPTVAASELLVGERSPKRSETLAATAMRLPTVILPAEAARQAGLMGSFLRTRGRPVPLPDLLIAATALWLDLPLLTWDGDYARSRDVARGSRSRHEGAELWRRLRIHPASHP